MGVLSAIRSLTLNLVLFVGLVLSHHLGGGRASFSPFLIPIFALSLFVFWAKPVEIIRGPYLALLLVFIQILGHFELAASANISTLRMTVSHVVGFTLSYFLASNFDQGVLSLVSVLRSFFEPVTLAEFEPISFALAIPRIGQKCYDLTNHFGNMQRRGPPALVVAKA